MAEKTKFERLVPSEQVAIETQLQKIKKEDLENCWKEMKAKETRHKTTSAGDVIIILLFVFLICLIFFLPLFQINNLKNYVEMTGPYICKVSNETYITTTYSYFISTPKIICSNNVFRGSR